MFRQLAPALGAGQAGADAVFALHPMQHSRFLEEVWANRTGPPPPPPASPSLLEVPATLGAQEGTSNIANAPIAPPVLWDHLIYAYMVENTRAYEVFRRVLEEYAFGERLDVPSDGGQRWLRTTEQLFFRESPPFQIYSLTSWIRPDARAMRRNAYFRMFGMDLTHGTDAGQPYPYVRATAANTEFVPTFEEFLREVWRGIENFNNQSGAKPTDDAAIANLARRLFDMLTVRRANGNLAREELWYVATMSWFHLTLEFDTAIVADLKAQASSPEERLLKIGERVGLPAHSRSGAYFRLADATSAILEMIELPSFNTPATVPGLYTPGTLEGTMRDIIRDWSIATGRDLKARGVSLAPPWPTTTSRPPRPIASQGPGSNGHVVVQEGAAE
jgi:hypothetical protein